SRVDGRRRIWRGPCSLNTNWLLATGLRRHGRHDLAGEIAARSRALVERGGFNEFFDPLDGTPVGEPEFGWATLAAGTGARRRRAGRRARAARGGARRRRVRGGRASRRDSCRTRPCRSGGARTG